jgi:DNA ligase D-like protein (predicted polymerase)
MRPGSGGRCPPERGFEWIAGARLVRVRIGRREVQVTNLEKVFFPERGLTKGDLIHYYLDVAECLLPHVRRRPMQMLRYPDGVDGFSFYQKRVPNPHPDWIETVHIVFPGSGRTADFPVVTDAASVAWIANLGCIDLHTWHCRVDDIECPDYMLIDLDPSEGNPWDHVRTIALVVKEVLDELDLPSFPKTSGATGLHIQVPIRPELRWSGGSTTRTSQRRRGRWPTDAASSSTMARTPATGRSHPRTRSARRRTLAPPRRFAGRRWRRWSRRPSRSRQCARGSRRSET